MTFFALLFFRIIGGKPGKNCLIGLNPYIRKDKKIPDNTRLTSVGAVSFKTAGKLEKH